jgi:hypothetical protein
MIKSSVEKLADVIGFEIGMSDDVTQSNLIKGFCNGLANSMDDNKLGTQICYIVDKLDQKSFKVITEMAKFIELKVRD